MPSSAASPLNSTVLPFPGALVCTEVLELLLEFVLAQGQGAGQMLDESKNIDARAYWRYTEMVGELAACYTWQSLLLFDYEEYRQRQTKQGFPMGTDAPLTCHSHAAGPWATAGTTAEEGNNRGQRQPPHSYYPINLLPRALSAAVQLASA